MDDDNSDSPFTVWQMFNAPTLVLFNNLEHAADGLDRLLISILKLSGDFSEVLVPRPGVSKCPDSYYCAFNTWLIGRLFYICSVDDLQRIHTSSKNAQLKILNILCTNGASFYRNIHSEYYTILKALLKYYEDYPRGNQNEIILNNFTPEKIEIPNVDLQHIYVKVENVTKCKSLIDLVLQLLSDSIPPGLMYTTKLDSEEKLFVQVLYAMENFNMDLKYMGFRFFLNLIKNTNTVSIMKFNEMFPRIFQTLLSALEALVQCMDVLHDKSEIDNILLNNLNTILLEYVKLIENNHKQNLVGIVSSILSNKSTRIFDKELHLYCLSLSNKINLSKDLINISDMDASQIHKLSQYYSKQIIEYIECNRKAATKLHLNRNWYYTQVISTVNSFKTCAELNANDMFLVNYHLQRCYEALGILELVRIDNEMYVSENIETFSELISKKTILAIWHILIKVIQQHQIQLVNNESSMDLVMNIVLSTINLSNDIVRDDTQLLLQILCFQTSSVFTEHNLSFGDLIKTHILKYLLLAKLYLQAEINDDLIKWQKIIKFLHNSVFNCKDFNVSKKVIELYTLMKLNNMASASKIIEVAMPILMAKDDLQGEIIKVLPAIVCMSLGTFGIIVANARQHIGHVIFSTSLINVSVICYNCHNKSEKMKSSENFCNEIRKNYRVLLTDSNSIVQTNSSILISLKTLFGKFLNMKIWSKIDDNYWKLVGILCRHYYIFDYEVSTNIINESNIPESLRVFKPFIENTQNYNYPEWSPYVDLLIDVFINVLVNLTQRCLENNDNNLQASTLDSIKKLGLCCNDKLVFPVTKLLVYYIMHPLCSHAPKAIIDLKNVCEFHNQSPNQVYHRYKKDYCKLFVECSLYNGKDFAIYLLKVVRAFGFVGYRDFISKDIHHFLPYLIPYAVVVKEIPSMIEEIAALVQCSVSDFLIERFPHIYVHVYLTESDDSAKKCYGILEKLTGTPTLNLIQRHFRVILTEFLLQYCTNPERVLDACRYLAYHDPEESTPRYKMKMSTSKIAEFLNPKFLGVLAYFDQKLVNGKVALSVKRKALMSFPDIMQIMGSQYLTPLRFKVLATLRSALPLAKEFPKILAKAWGAFIYNIDNISLGPLLSNLAVSLLQQFEYAPNEINEIFEYMILDKESLLKSYISDLFFLEDSKISERVKIVIQKHVNISQPSRFIDKIKWYLDRLNHDTSNLKAYAFSHLNKLLKNNRSEIHKAIFGGKNIHPVMVELIDSLLDGWRAGGAGGAAGACLGQLGALEAGRLPRRYVRAGPARFAFRLADDALAAAALTALARAFRAEQDATNMDCYALSIQEILKIYEISPTGSKKEVWNSFPENMHQIMLPLLSSRYTLAYPSQPKKVHPLFGSVHATVFLEWAYNWTVQLIPLIEPEKTRELLQAVLPSMRRDVRTLFLFLPYVLLHAVMSEKNVPFIREEMMAVIGLENSQEEIPVTVEKSSYKVLRHIRLTPNINTAQAEGNQNECSKAVYNLLDFLNRWLLEWTFTFPKPLEHENYKSIKSFVDSFDKLVIARGNYACGELERALQYLELYTDDGDRLQRQLPLLAEIYALLDEPDSVAGILAIKRSEPSLKEFILTQVVTGRLQDAALCYERLAQEEQLDRHGLQGMIEFYLDLDQPFTAYRLLNEHDSDNMTEMSAEPLWRLGRFDQLEELVKKPVPPSRENWGLLMGRILLAYRKEDHDLFKVSCDNAISRLVHQIDGKSRGESALRSNYQSVLGLHIVTEAEHTEEIFRRLKDLEDGDGQSVEVVNRLLDDWRQRLSLVQSDFRTIEPLLRIRRILLQQTQELLEPTHPLMASKLKSCIGDLWLQSAKHARKAGVFQQSYMYILNAEEYKPEGLFVEKAKIYWARGQQEHVMTTLRRGIQENFPEIDKLTEEQRKICAKAKLLIAKYNDETTNVDVDVNIGYYKEAVEVCKNWEKSLVCLGSYYEKVSTSDNCNANVMWSRRLYALNSYGKALQYGHKYLYQSMPRMLSIWLDVEVTPEDKTIHSILGQMTEIIKTYSERLPLYLFLTAFSQIISRICHPVLEVYVQLKAILVRLVAAYPQHALWMSLSVLKSGYPVRASRFLYVLADERLSEPRAARLRADFTQLAECLIELCNKPVATAAGSTTVSALVRTLPRLLASKNFSQIMMPFQEFCKIVLPSKAARQEQIDINIPTEPEVYIAGIEEHIEILPSLQKPRKVTLRGSDGKAYIIMLKPRDDLRKDFRLMEFNGIVNRFLQDAPETRRRRLYIRTYSVLPLNEECGLIEWVPNLVGLRAILVHIYKQKGIYMSNRELKEMMCSNGDPVEKKRRIYEKHLLPRHPPVFQEWFRRVFSDPYGWYQARSAYIRTTAVMSMVGYILGLGDRHGENISFDSTNGDTVHVDFNCLFNKGETFQWPERVPFRLTHNMEAAMGPLKHEGMYRKSCEAVMRVLRSQTEALMSVVGPFVYDPLLSWGSERPKLVECVERTNEKALTNLLHIRQRLNGLVKTKNKQLSLSLSPEGQVEHLIVEATSVENLCQMYIGWGAFL